MSAKKIENVDGIICHAWHYVNHLKQKLQQIVTGVVLFLPIFKITKENHPLETVLSVGSRLNENALMSTFLYCLVSFFSASFVILAENVFKSSYTSTPMVPSRITFSYFTLEHSELRFP